MNLYDQGGSMPVISDIARGRSLERSARQIITPENVRELGIDESILEDPQFRRNDEKGNPHQPIGISINETVIGEAIEPNAKARDWIAYMNIGSPVINEFGDIAQPAPETVAKNEFVNLDDTPKQFDALQNFTIDNTTTWSITGEGRLTFQVRSMQFVEKQLETMQNSVTNIRGSYQQFNVDEAFTNQGLSRDMVHSEGEFLGSLQLAITGSVGGQITTSAQRSMTVSGTVPPLSRINVLATQRRKVRRFEYSFPVTFAGAIALIYPEPVYAAINAPVPNPVKFPPEFHKVIAYNLATHRWGNKDFTQYGEAEVVSSLEAKSIVSRAEPLPFIDSPL